MGTWRVLPDITTLDRLAHLFGVDLNYFSERSIHTAPEIQSTVGAGANSVIYKIKDTLGMNWNMSGENYVDADFSGISNVKDKLSGSSFKKCKLIDADLSDITFKGNSIKDCDFLNADLRNCKFYGSEVSGSSFLNASLIDALMVASEVRNCDFSNANLSGIEVTTSELRNNNIENTNWQHASFKDTQFTDIVFSGLLEECTFTSCAFSKVTFKNATLKNSFFKYCDLKRVGFIDCVADKLTYEFLKNCKANMDGIALPL